MNRKIHFYIIIFLLLQTGSLAAQSVTVNAKIDSTQLWIGNQTNLTFEVVQRHGQKVQAPIFSDTIVGNLDIVEQAKRDTIKINKDKIQVNVRYKVTSFKDSLVYIPPFPFVSGKDTFWSNSLSLKVIQPFVIDTTKNVIADIKPVFKPKFNWKSFIQKALLVLLFLALAVVLYILIRKFVVKKPILNTEKSESVIPPHVEALQKLDVLKEEKPWQKGRVKEYHTELTETIRIYIEKMFNINSMEMTSDEILSHAEFLRVDKYGAYSSLKQMLTLADLVKFAKWKPSTSENELSLMDAYLFVNQTKIEDVKPLEEVQEEIKNKEQA